MRVASSPDNDGTRRHCQTTWVRQARRDGVREKPASESSSSLFPPARSWWIWAGQRRALVSRCERGTLGSDLYLRSGGYGEEPRRCRGSIVGHLTRRSIRQCTWEPARWPPSRAASSGPVGRPVAGRCRRAGGGGSVVVRDRESRSHGEGVQHVRSLRSSSGGHW